MSRSMNSENTRLHLYPLQWCVWFSLHARDNFVCILNDHGLVTWPLFLPTSCCPNTSLCVSGQRTAWADVSSLKRKKKKAWCSLIEADLDKQGEKMKLTATKAPPNNTYHGSFPTALSNTMKHLQKAHSVNTFPKCGLLETEKTEGASVCCLVGK